jgi:hypothetical protein
VVLAAESDRFGAEVDGDHSSSAMIVRDEPATAPSAAADLENIQTQEIDRGQRVVVQLYRVPVNLVIRLEDEWMVR